MGELIFVVEEAPEGGLTARALGESIFTEAEDLPALREQIRDAVRCHFEEGHSAGGDTFGHPGRRRGASGAQPG